MVFVKGSVYLNTGRTRFKKNMAPWNKGRVGVMPEPWNKGRKNLQQGWSKGLTKEDPRVMKSVIAKIGKRRPDMVGNTFRKGLRSPNWKGGITSQDKLERVKFRKTVQKLVFERDGYACVLGGKEHGTDLQVDHIQSWKDYVELRFNIENCRTLCMKCHYEITFGKPMPPIVRAWGHNLKHYKFYKSKKLQKEVRQV